MLLNKAVLQIPYEIEDSLEPHQYAVVQHVVPLLTGLPYEKTRKIGTLLFRGPWTKHEFLKVTQQKPHEIEQI